MSLAHTRLLRQANLVREWTKHALGHATCGFPDDMEFMDYGDEFDRQALEDLDDGRDDEDDYPPDHPDRIAEEEYQRMQRLG